MVEGEEVMELEEAAREGWGMCYGDGRPDTARGHDNHDRCASRSTACVSSMYIYYIGSNRFGWL